MKIELSKEDLEIIRNWYESASGESASGLSVSPLSQFRAEYKHCYYEEMARARNVKGLLDRLGIQITEQDQYQIALVGGL